MRSYGNKGYTNFCGLNDPNNTMKIFHSHLY